MDNENDNNKDDIRQFKLSPPKLTCDKTSLSFRYCFKGPDVPTRTGGFWTRYKANGYAYVVRAARGAGCSEFGADGGVAEINNEDIDNQNQFGNVGLNGKVHPGGYHPYDFIFDKYPRTRVSFCRVGDKGEHGGTDYMEVGHFDYQTFGLFVQPGAQCPKLLSPYGILDGMRQAFKTDDENYLCHSKVLSGKPPVRIEGIGTTWAVCQYNPKTAKRY